MKRRYELFVTLFVVMALIAGMIVSAIHNNSLDKQHQLAVNAGVYDMCATEREQPAPAHIPTTEPEPITAYYDIPLTHSVQDHIFAECEKHNIQPEIIVAMIHRESDYDANNLGDGGNSYGLMQIQPRWHSKRMEKLNCTDLFDPYQNITVGIDYLAELLDKYDGDIAKALTAYNQGSYKGTITNYAKSILNNAKEVTIIND